ncbi:hypothetical protein NDU88_010028 [Pleurodeles waltl]|uniref:Uncharacterized protein n=1 Tax=Pleurodeles waltl TaxID=8319 RepID=A0AAV7RYB7_PLEWA|nr:hypothetical protein NDU88_010028 [Pleurodeles waltl]
MGNAGGGGLEREVLRTAACVGGPGSFRQVPLAVGDALLARRRSEELHHRAPRGARCRWIPWLAWRTCWHVRGCRSAAGHSSRGRALERRRRRPVASGSDRSGSGLARAWCLEEKPCAVALALGRTSLG